MGRDLQFSSPDSLLIELYDSDAWINKIQTGYVKLDMQGYINPLPDNKILDWSKLKQSANDNFKFDENTRKFSKRVENTVGKGEIAHYEQFLLFPQCFQKACFPGASKVSLCGNGLNSTCCLNYKYAEISNLSGRK